MQRYLNATAGAIWFIYIFGCCDGSFYTGVTTDINRRLREHQEGTASRYTRTRRPIVLAYLEEWKIKHRWRRSYMRSITVIPQLAKVI